MKAFLFGSLGAAAVLLCAALVEPRQWNRSYEGRYQIHSAGALERTFVFDPKTGRMWRYYWTTGSGNQLVSEGMVNVTYSDPPEELKAELLKRAGSPAR